MAQKAAKTLAARNTSLLLRTHITTASLHAVLLLLHFVFGRPASLWKYLLLTSPTLVIEFYFERLGRPRYDAASGALRSPGEDLDAPGLTEYCWDVLYWTWGCMGAACIFGDYGWWMWVVVPLYSIWLAYTTFMGVKSGLPGAAGMDMGADEGAGQAESKRQKKLEKRGQRVKYR
ncbi:hypothetical protein TMEN_4039 [Trichophyton mentagrophytes]|uniref:DUF788 domain-containing protein n=3 Tax=Trichophyton TaxID=5550 RepID=A0A9P5CXD1_9EURO|nr:hypothetical protein TESG_01114 [Trichophyton tonsurans CBS 112818]EZF36409.1 hypothetical protein H101_00097 [Trichophyton interdigitale H6]KAF3896767.1 DUF788 domain-containing protein [Trichophyton interdigitale]KDB23991.1 hypothetical protein H109_04096 [Trichophyton interdigitale MR816]GBF61535.1 hypothetical protein TMEN_4039 [Trichophyton mentagrophytes]